MTDTLKFYHEDVPFEYDGVHYTISIAWNGEFYQAKVIDPPNTCWNCYAFGETRDKALTGLVNNLQQSINKAA